MDIGRPIHHRLVVSGRAMKPMANCFHLKRWQSFGFAPGDIRCAEYHQNVENVVRLCNRRNMGWHAHVDRHPARKLYLCVFRVPRVGAQVLYVLALWLPEASNQHLPFFKCITRAAIFFYFDKAIPATV